MNCEGMSGSTGFMPGLCGFSQVSRRVIAVISAGSFGFVQSVRDVAANIRKMDGFVLAMASRPTL
ncbi:hypothetical protein [Acidithiobacillus sulfuriphilus]|uniref:hypothetical protein n=1 Tax=Acidithiobacillus sulfuriphilus TaxID=1867749 RepID=UPI003F633362